MNIIYMFPSNRMSIDKVPMFYLLLGIVLKILVKISTLCMFSIDNMNVLVNV